MRRRGVTRRAQRVRQYHHPERRRWRESEVGGCPGSLVETGGLGGRETQEGSFRRGLDKVPGIQQIKGAADNLAGGAEEPEPCSRGVDQRPAAARSLSQPIHGLAERIPVETPQPDPLREDPVPVVKG